MDFFMLRYLKWFFLIVFSIFFANLLMLKFTVYSFNSFFEDDIKRMNSEIPKLQKQYENTALKMAREARKMVVTPVSKPEPVNKVATFEYTKPRKSNISLRDKACNDAIFKTMSDKSEEAKAAKKELCAHNLK